MNESTNTTTLFESNDSNNSKPDGKGNGVLIAIISSLVTLVVIISVVIAYRIKVIKARNRRIYALKQKEKKQIEGFDKMKTIKLETVKTIQMLKKDNDTIEKENQLLIVTNGMKNSNLPHSLVKGKNDLNFVDGNGINMIPMMREIAVNSETNFNKIKHKKAPEVLDFRNMSVISHSGDNANSDDNSSVSILNINGNFKKKLSSKDSNKIYSIKILRKEEPSIA